MAKAWAGLIGFAVVTLLSQERRRPGSTRSCAAWPAASSPTSSRGRSRWSCGGTSPAPSSSLQHRRIEERIHEEQRGRAKVGRERRRRGRVSARSDLTLGPVAAAETWPLRKRILRPHQEGDAVVLPGDDDPRAAHIGARDAAGELVGSRPSPAGLPVGAGAHRRLAPARAWRRPEERRRRGSAHSCSLRRCSHVARARRERWSGATRASAPSSSTSARASWRRASAYVDPLLGPHVPMQLELEGDRSG